MAIGDFIEVASAADFATNAALVDIRTIADLDALNSTNHPFP